MRKIVLDTSVLIDYVRGKDKALINLLKLQDKGEVQLIVPSIVVFEFYSGQSLNKKEIFEKTDRLFEKFKIVEIGEEISKLAAKINRKYRLYNVIGVSDLLIRATTLFYSAYLATKNKKDFKKIKGLKLFKT